MMKTTMITRFLIVVVVFLSSCASVSFDHPLPESAPATAAFSEGMPGKYYLTDSVLGDKDEPLLNALYHKTLPARDSFHLISADVIIEEKLVYNRIKIRSYYKRNKADTLRLSQKHTGTKKTIEGKYVIYEERSSDTLLNLYRKDVLKLYNKAYYLSHYLSEKDWNIYRLLVNEKGELEMHITNEVDREVLSKFTVSPPGNASITVHLSDPQFYEFVKNGGFSQRFKFAKYK